MKIIDNTKEVKKITFEDIKIGDVFRRKDDERYYMRTERMYFDKYNPWYDDLDYDYRNAVCLSDGKITKIMSYSEVIPVDCELIIK